MMERDGVNGGTWEELQRAASVCDTTDRATTDRATAADHKELGLLDLLHIDLVVDELLKYISFQDMKVLRSVSLDASLAVQRSKTFLEKVRVDVNEHAVTSGVLHGSTCLLWKHLSFDLYAIPDGALELNLFQSWLGKMSESTQTLSLYNSGFLNDVTHKLTLLKQFKKVRALELYTADLFRRRDLADLLSFDEFQQLLSQLDSLTIKCSKKTREIEFDNEGADDEPAAAAATPFFGSFSLLSSHLHQQQVHLKKFAFSVWVLPSLSEEAKKMKYELFRCILRILDTSKETLQEVQLQPDVWKSQGIMAAIRFPKLKRLVANIKGSHLQSFNEFLMNQPFLQLLQELDITVFGIFSGSTIFMDVNQLRNLRKLRISNQAVYGTPRPVDWTFLREMTELDEFEFHGPDPNHHLCFQVSHRQENSHDITRSIVSRKLTKLTITGTKDFWEPFARFRPRTPPMAQYFMRFQELTELNFLGVPNAIYSNSALQSLISCCPKLRKFAFAHCINVSDSGLDGSFGDTNIAIHDLKGLVALAIWFCPNISSHCLTNVIRFEHLQTLEFIQPTKLELEPLVEILSSNPCLKNVLMDFKIEGETEEEQKGFLEEIREKARIIRPCVELVVPECAKMGW